MVGTVRQAIQHWYYAGISATPLDGEDRTISHALGDKKLAVAVIHRDLEGLQAELEFERAMAQTGPLKPVVGNATRRDLT
ncbi:MAG: hypothetical protein ABI886_15090 [Betaproteobacteria bacterium]